MNKIFAFKKIQTIADLPVELIYEKIYRLPQLDLVDVISNML